ncbi:hypothetical protein B0T18DRAFT_36988 [Schizothecium vesticola]|uniref:Uncharacterized protein n=1 Tax=Schizothecium vesticola TaxID=314040 RepID=A0AA40FAV5_9PEZI|nr:hypothetical protein B0T18DRAFT_36988 [Schizothecium vesticola]
MGGSAETCRPARLVLSYSSSGVSSPARVPGVGQSASAARFGPVRGQTARVPTRPALVGVTPSSHQPWGAETRPAGRTALARRICPSQTHHQRAFFPTAPFPDRDNLPDVSPSGARVAITCPISPHGTSQPEMGGGGCSDEKQVVSWRGLCSRALRRNVSPPTCCVWFPSGTCQRPWSIAASQPFGRENEAREAKVPNGQAGGQ